MQYRAIPEGYMRVGELAKKAGVTVRTLQYYDKEGLLSPSAESEGGFRLYNDRDMARLIQILMMKQMGFSLADIKKRLTQLDTPADVIRALTEQAAEIRRQVELLSKSLEEIEALKAEIAQMDTVDFKKYAAILVNLQMKNEMYWLIKYFDDELLNHLQDHFDQESGKALMSRFRGIHSKAIALLQNDIAPESEQGLTFAKEFWGMVEEFSGGDLSMLPKMTAIAERLEEHDDDWKRRIEEANKFIEPALEAYFTKMNYNPFETHNPFELKEETQL